MIVARLFVRVNCAKEHAHKGTSFSRSKLYTMGVFPRSATTPSRPVELLLAYIK